MVSAGHLGGLGAGRDAVGPHDRGERVGEVFAGEALSVRVECAIGGAPWLAQVGLCPVSLQYTPGLANVVAPGFQME